ncbi:MAG: hypothetical protein J6Y56_04110 [Fibrobacterales bacterium]|nr:hypothetical protein [Fibrobacterales bacterium]
MKKLSIFALLCTLFALANQAEANTDQPFLVCTWSRPGMVDYIDYIPGEYVIGRGSEFDGTGRFVRYCSFDTLAVSDLLLRGEYETDVIGMIDDTLANLCDSAAFAEAFETKFGMRYRASVECNETRKVFSVLPVEIFKNALNLPMDTLIGAPMLGKVIKDTLAAPGMYGPYKQVPLERNDLVRFYCDSSCYMYTIDYWTYVESGDSVLLCHKDSVLRRNGVCHDLQALRDTAGSVNVRPFPKEGDASVDSAPRVAGTTRFARIGSMLKMDIAKAGMLEVSTVDGKVLRRSPLLPGERWLDLSAFAPGFLAVRVGGVSTSLYWEGAAK